MLLPGKIFLSGEKGLILKVFRCKRKCSLPLASFAGVFPLASGRNSVSEQLKGGDGRQRGVGPSFPIGDHAGGPSSRPPRIAKLPAGKLHSGPGLSTCARAGVGSRGFGESQVKVPASNSHHTSPHPLAPRPALSRQPHAVPSTLKTQTGHFGPYLPNGKNRGRESGAEDERRVWGRMEGGHKVRGQPHARK